MMDAKWGYHQGLLCPLEDIAISPLDHGFCYGIGAFESFRTFKGCVPLYPHGQRLLDACRSFCIQYYPDMETIRTRIQTLCFRNGLTDARVRWTVSAGIPTSGYRWGQRYDQPIELLLVEPLVPVVPIALYALQQARDPLISGSVRRKSLQYGNQVQAHQELFARGVSADQAEGLFLTVSGDVCEGVYTNIFWRKGNVWYTPAEQTGCLLGVTRQYVLQVLQEQGWVVEQVSQPFTALVDASELFVTNAVRGIVPIVALYDQQGVVRRTWEVGQSHFLWQHAITQKWQQEASG